MVTNNAKNKLKEIMEHDKEKKINNTYFKKGICPECAEENVIETIDGFQCVECGYTGEEMDLSNE